MSTGFWKTQPLEICHLSEKGYTEHGSILTDEQISKISTTPVELPDDLYWDILDPYKSEQLVELEQFINANYVGDDIILSYSVEFFKWFICKKYPQWALLLRTKGTNKLIGCIFAVLKKVKVLKPMEIAETNFLCIHSDYRKKDLLSVIVKEITRRIGVEGIYAGIYTSSTQFSDANIANANYYHFYLDIEPLHKIGFFGEAPLGMLEQYLTAATMSTLRNVTSENFMYVVRQFKEEDIEIVVELYNSHVTKYAIAEIVDEDFLRDRFLSNHSFMHSWIIEKVDKIDRSRNVVGFFSTFDLMFYVPSTGQKVKVAYIYYNFGDFLPVLRTLFSQVGKTGAVVIQGLNIGNNNAIMKQANMYKGSSSLNYYLYNHRLPQMQPALINYVVF